MSDDFQQRGGSPWGSPPGGGGSGNGSGRGPRPPDVDKIIKECINLENSLILYTIVETKLAKYLSNA